MKAMVLAAGLGLRMRPLTLLRAKPVLPVLDRPLLHWTLERLREAGVREVVVNLHHLPRHVRRGGRRWPAPSACASATRASARSWAPAADRARCGVLRRRALPARERRRLLRLRPARARGPAPRRGALATLALRRAARPARLLAGRDRRRGRILSIAGRPRPASGTVSMFASVHVLDPRCSTGCRRARPTACATSICRCSRRGRTSRASAARARGTISAVRRSTATRSCGCCAVATARGPGRAAAPDGAGAAARRSVVGARSRVAKGARVERSVLWPEAVVEAGARVVGSIVTHGRRGRSG